MKDNNKKLKQEYRLAKRPLGVFLIRNTTNDKVYLGAGTNIQGIINRHKFALSIRARTYKRIGTNLAPTKFEFEILDQREPSNDTGFDARSELQAIEEIVVGGIGALW